MLTARGCATRRERLWKASPSLDLLIVGDPTSLVYLANYVPSPFEFRTNESAAILVLEPGRATLVGDDMLGPYLGRAHADEVVAPAWYDGQHAAPHRRNGLVAAAVDRLENTPGTRVGVEMASVPAGLVEGLRLARPGLELIDIGPIIRPLRRQKDPDEVEVLRRAMRAGEAAHAAALRDVRPGMTELEVYRLIQGAATGAAGGPAVVYGDFASGPRTWRDKGGLPTSRAIEAGDLLLLDFSVVVDGYRGDFTDTFAVGGGPTPRQRELFEACVGALAAAEATLKAGTPARAVDAAVRDHFDALGLLGHFPHHSGHGIGLGHPEPPYLVPHSDETLLAGDVIAVEPGLYVEEVGGMRYERNYLVTADGFATLSDHEIRIRQ